MKYHFRDIEKCNMCGDDTRHHKILGKRLNRSQGKNPSRKTGITTTVCRCTSCGLIYSNPQPVPFNIQDHYGIPPEDYWKESYFEPDENYFQYEIAKLRTLCELKPGMKSLDIGAGLGKQMLALQNAGFDAYGLEPSSSFYEMAVTRMGIPEEKLKLGMMEETEYPENHFDFVSFGAVLEHLYDPSASIARALRWTKPGGLIHIEVPSSDWLTSKIINLYYKLRFSGYVANLSPMHEPFHLFEFALKSFQSNAKIHHYQIAFSEYYVCETYLPRLLDPILTPYMKKTNQGMQLCVWLKKRTA